jgi:glutathione S-transferase/GST-like protein
MLEVYTWEPNANSGKPLLTLKEKGVPFEFHYINMGERQQHSPEYLKINPNGTVPTVIHDGFAMFESTPMMEYVDQAFEGPRLTPEDPPLQWRMRWWMRYVDEYLNPSLAMQAGTAAGGRMQLSDQEKEEAVARIPLPERQRAWRLILSQGTSQADLEESRRRVAVAIARFEAALLERPYLAGPAYSLADINAMTTLHSWPLMRPEINPDDTPGLWAWFRRCHDRPAIREAFTMGRFIGTRMNEVRARLGLEG